MATIEYGLFRAKFIKSSQTDMFLDDLSPGEIFLKAVSSKPSRESKSGLEWHLGNLKFFDSHSGYFALGRTTKSTIAKYDELKGDFEEEELEESPYTHCVFDSKIGIVGIAKKPKLSPTHKGIANRLQELLTDTDVVSQYLVEVEVAPIPEPGGFIKSIRDAFAVFRFTATFKGPNPFDADEYFQKPLAIYCQAANAEKGKAAIVGRDLNREVITNVTRSTAATGNEASARIKKNRGSKATTVHLRGDAVRLGYSSEEHDPEKVLIDLRAVYNRIRHNE